MHPKTILALQRSIQHWKTMLDWARTQPEKDFRSASSMREAIKQDWFSSSCALCRRFSTAGQDCQIDNETCPLMSPLMSLGCENCCLAWRRVAKSNTWAAWIQAAEKMIEYMESKLLEVEST